MLTVYNFRLFGFLLLFSFLLICHQEVEKQAKPNVLLILLDDAGWGDFGFQNNPYVNTPILNHWAKQAVSFDRFYVSPVYAPTRASILTGLYHLRTGSTWVMHRNEIMRSEGTHLAENM